ncbi:CpaF family protein [Phenylobacterium hankyongense]|uniref:CpaF family protein n=1 Tax=Phenylobacterium hankyongense TaxID=1813876 RepID=A0A328B0W5_9CAUL|nr:CpaF family protein [Phenylobacterium hankyongense]RAK60803.1 CpaF family protein [Phenylobacterium hankyongense]
MRLSFVDPQTPAPVTNLRLEPAEDRSFQTRAIWGQRDDAYFDLKTRMHRGLIERMTLSGLDRRPPDQVRAEVSELVIAMLQEDAHPLNADELRRLNADLMDELLGYGPLEPLLRDPEISDILVNTAKEVYVDRRGRIEPTTVRFSDEQHLLRVIERIVDKVGRRIDESQPMVDARLPDGSRVNAVVPPIAVDGALLSIRRFARVPYDLPRLVANGTISSPTADLLSGLVKARLNILISGGTGTGKTTLLNAMSEALGEDERIVTIEDAAELQLQQHHVVRMETRPSNIEGRGEVTQRELVKNSLRMRPDRIIVGEVRAGEAFDMLQAMNTGHDGSMTTVHANTPRDALTRLEQMIGMAGVDVSTRSMRAQIASAIQIVIQLKRFSDGARRLVSLQEIEGMEGDVITMQELMRFEQTHIDEAGRVHGRFGWTGIRPRFFETFRTCGLHVPTVLAGPAE